MKIDVARSIVIIAICAVITFSERALPFVVFRKGEVPGAVRYLGKVLAPAIMTTLVFYCMKGITFNTCSGFIPQIAAAVVTLVLHLWKRNTMISIVGGTLTCMLLTQFIF